MSTWLGIFGFCSAMPCLLFDANAETQSHQDWWDLDTGFYRFLYAKKNELTEFKSKNLLRIYNLNLDRVRIYSFPG